MKRCSLIPAVLICLAALIFMTGCPQSIGDGLPGGDEPYVPFSTVYVQVTDSIGGTFVSGTTLKVYKSGTTKQIGDDYTVTNGKVKLENLATETRYDFELIGIKGQWAGSRLENYMLPPRAEQTLSLIQPEHLMITRGVKPPKIVSVQADIPSGSAYFFDIKENTVITGGRKVRLIVESESAAGFDENFGYGRVNVLEAAKKVRDNAVPAANKFYSEGRVTVTVKQSGIPVQVTAPLTLCDESTKIPLAYIRPNNRTEIEFKGLVKGRQYSIFASYNNVTKKGTFTVSGGDQDVVLNFN